MQKPLPQPLLNQTSWNMIQKFEVADWEQWFLEQYYSQVQKNTNHYGILNETVTVLFLKNTSYYQYHLTSDASEFLVWFQFLLKCI